MFKDYTCFASDLIYFCVKHGYLEKLLDCTDAKDVTEECMIMANCLNKLADIPKDMLIQVCQESGAEFEELADMCQHDVLVKAIFVSMPDTGSEEFMTELMECVYYFYRRYQNTAQWRQTVYKFAELIDEL